VSVIKGELIPALPTGYTIDQSLRFNSAYLNKTWGSAPTDGNKFTYSVWVKRGNLDSGAGQYWLLGATLGAESNIKLYYDAIDVHLTGSNYDFNTSQVFRDSSAWYHLLFVYDSDDGTASDRFKIYVNGTRITDFSTSSTIPSGAANEFTKNGITATIGAYDGNNHIYNGYLSEVNFIDGQALTPTDFGEFDETYGHWIPKAYEGTYGTNGFYLDFADSGSIGNDVSGNNNDWTPTNLAATDQMLDSPTNNFATLNPLWKGTGGIVSQGNLQYYAPCGAHYTITSTQFMGSGKWYAEIYIVASNNAFVGLSSIKETNLNSHIGETAGIGIAGWNGTFINGVWTAGGVFSYGAGDIISIATDMDIGSVTFRKNNTESYTYNGLTDSEYTIGFGSECTNAVANFGQDSSFAGNKTVQSNTDDNGYGDFYYSPPTGYLALCTQNLDDPAVIPSEHFNTVLWSGNGVGQSITGVGFQPDFVWVKNRSISCSQNVWDKVRGDSYRLRPSATDAEELQTGQMQSLDSDGFTVGGSFCTGGQSGDQMVAWNWKANGAGVSNTDGTITSTVSANVAAGQSIVDYVSGSGSTVGHGLNQAPELVIFKRRDTIQNWIAMFTELLNGSNQGHSCLNRTDAIGYSSTITLQTDSSVLTIGSHNAINSLDVIAYCFHSVDGYSKVGSYTGNGSSDGTFVYTGFRPAWMMMKRTNSTGHWYIVDNERDGYNASTSNDVLYANLSNAESDAGRFDFYSNGFKLRHADADINASGGTYIYIAFAEYPFKYTNAR